MGNIIPTSSTKLEKELVKRSINEKFCGLENFGNTCYCNSVLQVLYFCIPFRNEVIEYYIRFMKVLHGIPINNNTGYYQSADQTGGNGANLNLPSASGYMGYFTSQKTIPEKDDNLLLCLGELFYTITQQKSKSGTIAPRKFVDRVRRENELFRSYMHQDAHEFLNFLLNSIAELLQKQIKEKQKQNTNNSNYSDIDSNSSCSIDDNHSSTSSNSSNNNYNNNNNNNNSKEIKTFIHQIFEGILTNETKCLTCESVTNKDESFLDLSIDIEQNRSLTSCLSNFSSVEVLSKNDKFFCDKCNSLQEAQKRMKIKKLPNTFIIHLKRFKFIEAFQQYKKLDDRVVFPPEIIIQNTTNDIENPEQKFELFAVTVHVGSGPNHGHYISLIKSNDVWFRFDDDNIDIINESDIYNCFGNNYHGSTECGYLLFYRTMTSQS